MITRRSMRDRLEKMVRFKKFVWNELSSQDRVRSVYTTTSYFLEFGLHFHRTVRPFRARTWPVLGPTIFYVHVWRSSVHCSCAVVSIRDMVFLAIYTQSLREPCHEGTAESKSGDACEANKRLATVRGVVQFQDSPFVTVRLEVPGRR
jgi:hypothetical protein